jgi:hypothetical protein
MVRVLGRNHVSATPTSFELELYDRGPAALSYVPTPWPPETVTASGDPAHAAHAASRNGRGDRMGETLTGAAAQAQLYAGDPRFVLPRAARVDGFDWLWFGDCSPVLRSKAVGDAWFPHPSFVHFALQLVAASCPGLRVGVLLLSRAGDELPAWVRRAQRVLAPGPSVFQVLEPAPEDLAVARERAAI